MHLYVQIGCKCSEKKQHDLFCQLRLRNEVNNEVFKVVRTIIVLGFFEVNRSTKAVFLKSIPNYLKKVRELKNYHFYRKSARFKNGLKYKDIIYKSMQKSKNVKTECQTKFFPKNVITRKLLIL